MDRVIGGWQLSTLIKISSGTPFFFRSSNCNIPAQFEVGCIPSQTRVRIRFYKTRTISIQQRDRFSTRLRFQDPGSFNFNFGDGPRISSLRGPRFSNRTSASSEHSHHGARRNALPG